MTLVFTISYIINVFRAPDINSGYLKYLQGKTINGKNIDDFKLNFPLVLHFWGSWCPICKQEASNIHKLSEKYNVLTIASK